MVDRLRERGLVHFLRDYLAPDANGQVASLRKLLISFGVIPVSLAQGYLLPTAD